MKRGQAEKMLSVLLFAVSLSAFATDWKPLVSLPPGDAFFADIVYVDVKSIKAEGRLTGAMVMGDYAKYMPFGESGKSFRSFIAQFFIDCRARKVGFREITAFSESGGAGDVVNRETREFVPVSVQPGTLDEALYDFVCSRR